MIFAVCYIAHPKCTECRNLYVLFAPRVLKNCCLKKSFPPCTSSKEHIPTVNSVNSFNQLIIVMYTIFIPFEVRTKFKQYLTELCLQMIIINCKNLEQILMRVVLLFSLFSAYFCHKDERVLPGRLQNR